MRPRSLLLVLGLAVGLLLLGLSPTLGQDEVDGPDGNSGGEVGAVAGASGAVTGEAQANYLSWYPPGDKFLIIDCIRGQISNRILCMRNHIIAAALLNRTLIAPRILPGKQLACHKRKGRKVPPPVTGYYLPIVWDVSTTRECFGGNSVIDDVEYERRYGRKVFVSRIQCWNGPEQECRKLSNWRLLLACPLLPSCNKFSWPPGGAAKLSIDPWHVPNDSYLYDFFFSTTQGTSTDSASQEAKGAADLFDDPADLAEEATPAVQATSPEHRVQAMSCLGQKTSKQEFLEAYGGLTDRVLALGDLVTVEFTDNPVDYPQAGLEGSRPQESLPAVQQGGQPGGREECLDVLRMVPARELVEAARTFRRELFREEDFVGIHWRRGDFAPFCFLKATYKDACFYSPAQAANCTARFLNDVGIRNVFLATNADSDELQRFKDRLQQLSVQVLTVKQLPNATIDSVHQSLLQSFSRQGIILKGDGTGGGEGGPELPRGVPTWESQWEIVAVVLEKLLCAMSTVFLGSIDSTFTTDIYALRKAFRMSHPRDSYVCFKEPEWHVLDGLPEYLAKKKMAIWQSGG